MIEAMKQALEALEFFKDTAICSADTDVANEAITALRQAIEQAEKQEPVAWMFRDDPKVFAMAGAGVHIDKEPPTDALDVIPLYTHPQPKAEKQDGNCQHCGGKGCVACDARKQEPVAWMYWQSCLNDDGTQTSPWVQRYSKFEPPESIINKEITPLYTHPQPKREPLTFEQVENCFPDGGVTNEHGEIVVSTQWLHDFSRAIEAAHGIKGEA